jgi:hypothetical protein
MRAIHLITAVLAAFFASPATAQIITAPTRPAPTVVQAPPRLLQTFQVASGTIQDLSVPLAPTQDFSVEIVLGGRVCNLLLLPHELRRTGFQLLVDNGTSITAQPSGALVTFQGSVIDPSGSIAVDTEAAVVVQNGQLKGIVREGTTIWGIQPLRESDPLASVSLHLVFRAADNWNLPYVCGVPNSSASPVAPGVGIDVIWNTDLALEIDFPQYQRFNNVPNATNDALMIVNAMDVIYRRDCSVSFVVGTVLVRTVTDPYTSTDAGTLLGQFQGWWNSNQGAVTRDVAMLFTGRAINGNVIGVAYLSQVCNTGSAYGLTETMYNGIGTNVTSRTGLISHEMGHLFSATHCDSLPDCRIMCAGLGGCSGNISSFSASEITQITTFRSAAPCLSQSSSVPIITTISPTSSSAFTPATVVINGTGFTGVNQVTIGSQVITTNITILSDTQMRVIPPDATTLGFQLLRVINPAGTSNPVLFIYTDTTPIELVAPAAALGGSNITFRYGGRANQLWYLGIALFPTIAPLQGFNVLTSFSGLTYGALNAVGIGQFTIPIPPGVLNGLTLYEQVLEFNATTLQLSSSSNVITTRYFL